jgi:DNA (cytosine-5)-methyltransferase 1
MLRAIREIRPRWVVGENVLGLVNWSGGLVFNEVQADLEAAGYEVQPYILPACAVNAPHRRDRVWFVAYSRKLRLEQRKTSEIMGKGQEKIRGERNKPTLQSSSESSIKNASYSNGNGLNQRNGNHEINSSQGGFDALGDINESNGNGDTTDTNGTNSETWSQREILEQSNRKKANGHSNVECTNQWQNFPTQSPICTGDDGISSQLDGITFSKWRNESIKAGGNAIVPQVVYNIFNSIELYENKKS